MVIPFNKFQSFPSYHTKWPQICIHPVMIHDPFFSPLSRYQDVNGTTTFNYYNDLDEKKISYEDSSLVVITPTPHSKDLTLP